MNEEIVNVFIYGTLKKDCCNHHILERITKGKSPIPVSTLHKYFMYKSDSYFPYLESRKNMGKIIEGELYSIPKSALAILDRFEGVPDLYVRGKIDVEFENMVYMDVNTYFKAELTDSKDLKLEEAISEWNEGLL